MAESDILAQLLLAQSRQQGRRQSASSRLADQMMASANNVTPVYSTGAALARAGSGLLAGLMAQRAEAQDLAREDEQMQRLQDRTDKRDYLNRQELASFLGGPSQAPIQMPQSQPQQQAMPPAPEGAVQRESLPPLPQVQPRGEAPPAVSQGIAQRAALDPDAADYAERIARINNGVVGQTMQGQPQPVPQQMVQRPAQVGAGAPPQSDAMTMYLRAVSSPNPMISRLAPGYLAQANREDTRAGRVNPTVEINGPQGPGTYERRQDGTLAFIGGRMPPQEGAETFGGAPQTVMQNGQPVLVQMGSRGTVRPMQGYGPRNDGPYQGTGIEAQDSNVLLRGDPASREYAAAYARQAAPRVNVDGSTVTPNMQAYQTPTFNPNPPAARSETPPVAGQPAPSAGAAAPDYSRGTVTEATRPTADQSRVATYATRMGVANDIIGRVGNATTDLVDRAVSQIPVAGNFLTSRDFQLANQAQRDFINATLRRESGAVISDAEFANARQQYFPQPGDSPEVLEQKRQNRETTLSGFEREAGPARQPRPVNNQPSPETRGWSGRVLP
jgi:hypothetical protein